MSEAFRPRQVISGGQTGADLGGLVGARRAGVATGGTAPRGFRTEAGPQPVLAEYGLVEDDSPDYPPRTRKNACNSDATVIFSSHPNSGGTRTTVRFCRELKRPWTIINPFADEALAELVAFVEKERPGVLNVAGNRESVAPGTAAAVAALVAALFASKDFAPQEPEA